MRPHDEAEIRASFVNASSLEQRTLSMPFGLDAMLWESLDYLGWLDPAFPQRGHMVVETASGLVGLILRLPKGRPTRARRALCSLCLTQQPGNGTLLMVARRSGPRGRNLDTVGTYMCADLACSLYLRGLRRAEGGGLLPETSDPEARIERLRRNVDAFVSRVTTE